VESLGGDIFSDSGSDEEDKEAGTSGVARHGASDEEDELANDE